MESACKSHAQTSCSSIAEIGWPANKSPNKYSYTHPARLPEPIFARTQVHVLLSTGYSILSVLRTILGPPLRWRAWSALLHRKRVRTPERWTGLTIQTRHAFRICPISCYAENNRVRSTAYLVSVCEHDRCLGLCNPRLQRSGCGCEKGWHAIIYPCIFRLLIARAL